MEGNEFSNGLLGHRVEGTCYKKETYQGIWIGTEIIDGAQWDRIVTDEGQIVRIDAVRVIRPQKEVTKPAEPYSIDTLEYCQRLVDEVMMPAGFASFYGEKGGYMTACKGEHRVFIDNEGVRLVHHGEQSYPDLPNIPLNEWVKNPTIESLKPKD